MKAAAITLERPKLRHADEFLRAVRRSRELHRGLVSPPRDLDQYRDYVRGLRKASRESFLVLSDDGGGIAGVVNVSEIVRGPFRSAYLGYYAFVPLAGRGFMREGLRQTIRHCFSELGLHRLEANVQPDNHRSIELVKSLGFRLEGYSPEYLKICGRWADHERWAILAKEWRRS
jgi:ribosomal-protein-alanine N-acetyltransferase